MRKQRGGVGELVTGSLLQPDRGRPRLRTAPARPHCDNSPPRRARAPFGLALIRRHRITHADNRRLAHLCGPLDAHLRQIEEALSVRIGRRNAEFRIEGAREAVQRTIDLIDRLHELAVRPIDDERLRLALVEAVRAGDAAAAGDSVGAAAAAGAATSASASVEAPVVLHTRHAELAGRTPNQVQYLRQMLAHDITFGIGPAGTGKTFLAVACAVDALERQGVQRIVLTRPAVEAGERLGFLPGDLAQKVDPYLRPLYDALYDLMGFDRVGKAFEKGQIEIAPLAFMRGRTLNHAFVILDEAQNTTREQMKMFLTRMGFRSKCVVTGDVSQIDLPKGMPSGLVEARQILADVRGIAFTDFTAADVVRHPLVARIVEAYEAKQPPRE
ncbi:MAG: PhoH family protein [Rubrivivax sp.]|nr:PhoH family protein [Rubrivivax sp.]